MGDEIGDVDELWVENEIGFGWISLGWWWSRWRRQCRGAISVVVRSWRDDLGSANSTARSRRCVWGWGTIYFTLSTLSLSLSLLSLSLSLSLSLFASVSLEMIWRWNRSCIHFPGQRPYFTVKVNDFPENSIFHTQPNTRKGVKGFPEIIWSQNKRSLSTTNHKNRAAAVEVKLKNLASQLQCTSKDRCAL